MRSFRLESGARSFHLEKADPWPPDDRCGHLSAVSRNVRSAVQWLLLLLQIMLTPSLCHGGAIIAFWFAATGVTIDVLVYDPRWRSGRTGDLLLAAVRTALAVGAMA